MIYIVSSYLEGKRSTISFDGGKQIVNTPPYVYGVAGKEASISD